MKSVFLLQVQRFKRAPLLLSSFFVMTLLFVSFLGGIEPDENLIVHTYADEGVSEEVRDEWLSRLNESEAYEFELVDEEEARQSVQSGERNMALALMEDDYRFLITVDDQTYQLVNSYVGQVFREELRIRQAAEQAGDDSDAFRENVEEALADPVLTVETTSRAGADDGFIYDNSLQVLFGMTLFFSVFTMLFSLSSAAEEKQHGTWDRLIISPLKKWEVYSGYLLFSFLVGFMQIMLIFLFFRFAMGFDLGGQFGVITLIVAVYAFAIVSLGVLIIGLVKNANQLQAVIPIVSVAMAMLGGAYWPIEVVSNQIMVTLAQGMPIYYAKNALIETAIFGVTFADLVLPLGVLLGIAAVCMVIGINLMERRA